MDIIGLTFPWMGLVPWFWSKVVFSGVVRLGVGCGYFLVGGVFHLFFIVYCSSLFSTQSIAGIICDRIMILFN